MLGIDGFRLHAPEESLRVVNRTPIVGLKKFRFDERRCGSFVCVRIEGDVTTTGSGARRWNPIKARAGKDTLARRLVMPRQTAEKWIILYRSVFVQ